MSFSKRRRHGGAAGIHDGKVSDLTREMMAATGVIDDFKFDCSLPMEESQKLRRHVGACLKLWTWLGVAADRRGDCLFSGVPKLHHFWHLGQRSLFLSPRRGATFIDEDFVKLMKQITARCVAGTPLHKVGLAMMEKYRWALHFEHSKL